jgi:DNA-binding NarL/FixJ family response regulator
VIRLIIVTDIRLYREGLAQVLGRDDHVSVCAAVGDLEDALTSIPDLRPEIVLFDLAMRDSLAAVRAIRMLHPDGKVVALGVPENDQEVVACAEAGIAGYVSRDAGVGDLVGTIESVARGELVCSPRVAAALRERVTAWADGHGSLRGESRLTARESEILALLERGLSNKDIARQLGIEVATVKNHVHSILDKLHVHRRGQAAARLRAPPPRRALGLEH